MTSADAWKEPRPEVTTEAAEAEVAMEAGVIVRVIKDFLTTTEGELCVAAGEILQVRSCSRARWQCYNGFESNAQTEQDQNKLTLLFS